MTKIWDDKKYDSLNYFLREKFGEKVFKISLDAGFTCPNRDGTLSKAGCIFCSPRGSGDFCGSETNLIEQFHQGKAMMNKKWKKGKYIVYFQAYTNTYADVATLRERYYSVLGMEDVVGIAIATRPDCLAEEVLDLLSEINEKTYLWVELGLQTIHEDTADFINRGYTLDTYISAVKALKARNIEVVTHAILGLHGEDKTRMLQTIDFIGNTGTQGIKIHLLHIIKGTQLAKFYESGAVEVLEKAEYADLIIDCLEILPENMVIHRITGDGPRATLIAPLWSIKKWEVINTIEDRFIIRNTWQGKFYKEKPAIMALFSGL